VWLGQLAEDVDGCAIVPETQETSTGRAVADERELGVVDAPAELVDQAREIARRSEHGVAEVDDDGVAVLGEGGQLVDREVDHLAIEIPVHGDEVAECSGVALIWIDIVELLVAASRALPLVPVPDSFTLTVAAGHPLLRVRRLRSAVRCLG